MPEPPTIYECPIHGQRHHLGMCHAGQTCREQVREVRVYRDPEPLELTAGQAAAIRGMRQTAPHTLTPHPTDPGALLVKDARGRHYHLTHTGAATRLTMEDETHA